MIISQAQAEQILSEYGIFHGAHGLPLFQLTTGNYYCEDCGLTHEAYTEIQPLLQAGLIRMGAATSEEWGSPT